MRTPERTRLAVAVGASVAVFALAAVAATAGSLRPFVEGTGGWRLSSGDAPPTTLPDRAERELPEQQPQQRSTGSLLADLIVRLLVVVVLLVLCYALVRVVVGMLSVSRARRRRRGSALEGEVAVPTGAVELADAVDDGLRALEAMPALDAIVACWVRLEAAAAEAGVARQPSETATELTLRVLRAYDVSPRPLSRLLSLYREARFSSHDISDDAGDDARAALLVVRGELLDHAAPRRSRSAAAAAAAVGERAPGGGR